MKLDRTGNAKRNIVYGLISKVIILLMPFLTRVVIIRVMGAEYLGLDSLFTSILQVLSITELGFSTAVVYSMYKPIADNDYETLSAILLFFKKVYRVIGILIFAIGLCITPFLPHLIHADSDVNINIYVLYIIYLTNTSISYFLFAYRSSLLNAYQREDIVSKINAIVKIVVTLLQIAVILLFRNYYLYAFAIVIGSVVNNIYAAVVTKKLFPQITEHGTLSKTIRLDIREKVSGLVIQKLCGTSRNAFDSIFISAFLGLTQVAIYNNYYYIMNAVTSTLGILTTSITAGVGNAVATESVEKNFDDLKRINFLYMLVSGWCTVCLVNLYQPFSSIVFGSNMLYPLSVAILFSMYFYTLKMGDVISVYNQGAGLWWKNRYRSISEALTNIILNYVLGKFFGVYGIILATWISLFFINFLWGSQIIFDNYFGKEKVKDYFLSNLKYAVITVCDVIIVWLICSVFDLNVYLTLIVNAVVCIFVGAGFYILVYRKTGDFKNSFGLMESMFKSEKIRKIMRKVCIGE